LAVPATLFYFSLQQIAHGGSAAYLHAAEFSMQLPRERFLSFALTSAASRFGHTIDALNVPGTVGDALLNNWQHISVLRRMTLDSRRALTFPMFCLPAWWLVGRGLDRLTARWSAHGALYLTGTALCIGCCVLAIGLRFETDAADRMDETWPIWGLTLWAVLFGVLPFAWWRQREASRTLHDW